LFCITALYCVQGVKFAVSCCWNPKIQHYIHHSIQGSSPLDPRMSQLKPFHIFTICFSKIKCNILPSLPASPTFFSTYRIYNQPFYRISDSFPRILHFNPSYLSHSDHYMSGPYKLRNRRIVGEINIVNFCLPAHKFTLLPCVLLRP
jgi:hypothetical protein